MEVASHLPFAIKVPSVTMFTAGTRSDHRRNIKPGPGVAPSCDLLVPACCRCFYDQFTHQGLCCGGTANTACDGACCTGNNYNCVPQVAPGYTYYGLCAPVRESDSITSTMGLWVACRADWQSVDEQEAPLCSVRAVDLRPACTHQVGTRRHTKC